jgi:hypothetical protein
MTVETKTTIQLSDVDTVEFKCTACGSVYAIPIGIAQAPPMGCHCDADKHWLIGGDETYRGIMELLTLVKRFGKAQPKTFELRFGLKTSASVPASSGKG